MPSESAEALRELLRTGSVDSDEFQAIAFGHFGNAEILEDRVSFPSDDRPFAMRMWFRGGDIIQIEEGEAVSEDSLRQLLKKVRDELLGQESYAVSEQIIFANVPTLGAFKYEDLFQIIPVPKEAPTPTALMGAHPAILEFRFRSSPNHIIQGIRRTRIARTLSLLLHVFLRSSIIEASNRAEFHWVVLPPKDTWTHDEHGHFRYFKPVPPRFPRVRRFIGSISKWLSMRWRRLTGPAKYKYLYLQELYGYEGMRGIIDGYSNIDRFPPLPSIEPVAYYSRRGIGGTDTLSIPTSLNDLLNRYMSVTEEVQSCFLRACYWFRHANVTWGDSLSASFQSLIQVVEALQPDFSGGEKCPKCQKSMEGPTKQFHSFIEKYCGAEALKDVKNIEAYRTRSKLSHGKGLLQRDLMPFSWGVNPREAAEGDEHRIVRQIARITLLQWLMAQDPKSTETPPGTTTGSQLST